MTTKKGGRWHGPNDEKASTKMDDGPDSDGKFAAAKKKCCIASVGAKFVEDYDDDNDHDDDHDDDAEHFVVNEDSSSEMEFEDDAKHFDVNDKMFIFLLNLSMMQLIKEC